jgi:tetratricopeptide (TPR) repeat protein
MSATLMPALSSIRRWAVLLALCAVVASPVRAQSSVLEDPVFKAEATRGLDHLYNMEFGEAEVIFDRLAARHPEHPVAPFLQALVPWWQILMDLSDTRHDDAFFAAMDEVVERSDRLLDRDGDNLDAKFFKGAALGFRGRLQSNRRRWLKAALDGKRAMDYVIEVADDAGANADFVFGKGIYDYYAAAVPERYPWSKPFVAMFPSGSKARGLAAMHRTFREGSYLQAESAYFLLQIYYLYERDYTKSQQFISWLRENYPDNAFFHAMEGRIYARFGRWDESEDVFNAVMRRHAQGDTGYNDAIAEQALYYLGRHEQLQRNYGQALALFYRLEQIAESRPQQSAFQTLGRLRQGMSHDARGERDKALRRYREVLRLEDFAGSHDRARRYIDRPYQG